MSVNRLDLPSGVSLHPAWCNSARDSDIDLEIQLVAQYLSGLAAARNSRSSLLRLPVELLDIILNDVYADYGNHAMRACALVCKHLVPFAQTRMFSAVRVSTPRECVRVAELAEERRDLCHHALALEIHDRLVNPEPDEAKIPWEQCADRDAIENFFASLDRVETLRAKSITDETHLLERSGYSWTPSVSLVLRRVKHLILEECIWESWNQFDNFIRQFSSLERLELVNFRIVGPLPASANITPLEHIRDFVVDKHTYKGNIFSWMNLYIPSHNLLSIDCPLAIKSLSLRMPIRLIHQLGSRLQYISFSGPVFEMGDAIDEILRSCTDIREVKINQDFWYQDPDDLFDFVSSLEGLKAETLVFTNFQNLGQGIDLEIIRGVCDKIQDRASFPALRTLRFEFGKLSNVPVLDDLAEAGISAREERSTTRQGYNFDLVTTYQIFDLVPDYSDGGEDAEMPTRRVELHFSQAKKEWPFHCVEEEWDSSVVTISIVLEP